MTPRRMSRGLGQGGLLYGSQESLCPSYLASYDRSRATSAARDLHSPSGRQVDLSLVYHHPPGGDGRRRAVSVDRDPVPLVGWRGTGGRVRHTSSSRRGNLAEDVFRFLPPEALNQTDPPKLVIKKSPSSLGGGGENGDDSGIEADDLTDTRRRKKRSSSSCNSTAEDRQRREEEVCQLLRQLERIHELLQRVQVAAEQLIQRQTTSEDFQKQMRKETEG